MASFLDLVAGRYKQFVAAVAGGPANAGQIASLDNNGRFTLDMMPTGIGPDSITLPTSEAVVAGAWVNISPTNTVRNASAAGIGTRAHGYAAAAAASGAQVMVMFDDSNTFTTNSPVGDLWLSATTPGQATTTPPTGVGVISQRLGVGITATLAHASIQEPVILAQ